MESGVAPELRLDQPLSYLAGLFYQNNNLTFDDATRVPANSALPPALVMSGVAGADQMSNSASHRAFEQDGEIWALFGQLTWSLSDQLNNIGRASCRERY